MKEKNIYKSTLILFWAILTFTFQSVRAQQTKEIVFRDIWVFNDSSSIVIGNYGVIERTVDKGKTWTTPKSNTNSNLNGIVFKDKKIGLICGTKGCILKTTDGGKTWTEKFSGTTSDLLEVKYVDGKNLYISRKNGGYLTSPDGGETWLGGENEQTPKSNQALSKEKSGNFQEVKEKLHKNSDFDVPKTNKNTVKPKESKAKPKAETQDEGKFVELEEGPVTKDRGYGSSKDSIVSSKLGELREFWSKYNYLASKKTEFESIYVLKKVFDINQNDTMDRNDMVQRVNYAQIDALKRQIGLSVGGNYQENFNPGVGANDLLVYKRRAQVGLDWNILGDGLVSSKYKQEILRNENTILGLIPKKNLTEAEYLKVYHSIIYAFNEHKIKLLQEREKIIEEKISTANDLFVMQSLKKIDLMEMIQQQVDVKSQYQIYKAYNEQLVQTEPQTIPVSKVLPVFDIVSDRLFNYSIQQQNDSIVKLKAKNYQLQNSFWNTVDLSANVRYNYYDLVQSTSSTRDFVSAGLSFSVPLPLNLQGKKAVVKEKTALEVFDQKTEQDAQNSEWLNRLYEFRYKLKQYNNLTESHKKYEELVRLERVKESLKNYDFNPISALNYLDELLGMEIDMLDLQQRMYIDLLDIYIKSSSTNGIMDLVMPYDGSRVDPERDSVETSMYIWSKSFTRHNTDFIKEYLKLNGLKKALISPNKNPDQARVISKLIDKLEKNNIDVEALIGNNNLLNDPDPELYLTQLMAVYDLSQFEAIHLDVEPQAMPEWDVDKEGALVKYIEMLKRVKDFCNENKLKLSVSIPTYFPQPTLLEIYKLADKVYVMAYENVKPEFIANKLREELAIGPNKTIVALRSQDFKNRLQLENLKKFLRADLKVKGFAFHDMEGFINMEKANENR
ncbi:MAG: hypothetical protein K1X82_13770 [Bacteroidia bacterium]|nr:hypothetical protein [Bacteroidia bacterium]